MAATSGGRWEGGGSVTWAACGSRGAEGSVPGLLVGVGYAAPLLGLTHLLLPSVRWAELCALGLGELLSLAGTAVCWDKCGWNCLLVVLHTVTVFLHPPLICEP